MQSQNHLYKKIALVAAVLWSGSAQAGFYIVHDDKTKITKVMNPDLLVSSSHVVPRSDRYMVKGFGKNVSLNVLAEQTMPKGWKLKCESKKCDDKVITWQADKPVDWKDIMHSGFNIINDKSDLLLSIDPKTKTVLVRNKIVAPVRWLIDGKKTLRENMESIVTKSGYKFVWRLGHQDWAIGHTQYVNGGMRSALDQLVYAFASKGIMLSYRVQSGVIEVDHKSSMADIRRNESKKSIGVISHE